MKHPLFVGYFDKTVRSSKPKITKPIDTEAVSALLARHCDISDDGRPMLTDQRIASQNARHEWLARVNQEDVLVDAGYLICPWLGIGVNTQSLKLILELHAALGVDIYEPGDLAFLCQQDIESFLREAEA